MEYIKDGSYFAWDPLTAVYLTHPSVVELENIYNIDVLTNSPYVGQTIPQRSSDMKNGRDNLWIATKGSDDIFNDAFFRSFID